MIDMEVSPKQTTSLEYDRSLRKFVKIALGEKFLGYN